jgi:hypothetical protein
MNETNINKQTTKKKLLFLYDNLQQSNAVCELLSGDYDLLCTESREELKMLLRERYSEFSAILIGSETAVENNYSVLKEIQKKSKFRLLPVLVVASERFSENVIDCLEYDAADFINPPYYKKIIKNRIENAIRCRDSASFYEMEKMLKELPQNIYIKDEEGRYIFATHRWHHCNHDSNPDWTIRGKTDADIRKDKENAVIAMKKDMEILRTGIGEDYVINVSGDKGTEYYEVVKRPLRDDNGNVVGIIGILHDITEHEILKQKLKSAASIDGLTGLYNRSEIQSRIELELVRVKKYGEKLSLIMLDIDNFKQVNDTYGHKEGDVVIIALAKLLKSRQTAYEKCYSAGRWGGEEFMLLLYDTEESAAAHIAELIRKCFANTAFANVAFQTVSLGVTQAREDDTLDTLCIRVDSALYKAKKSGKNCVVVL